MSSQVIVEVIDKQSALNIDESRLIEAVNFIVSDSDYESAEISIAVVGDAEMHEMNNQYLAHDYPTDVLSFPLEATDRFLAGEIIVSSETAIKESAEHGLADLDELLLYVVHGTLHLVGYDDKDPNHRKVMREKETVYMRKLGVDLRAIAKDHE